MPGRFVRRVPRCALRAADVAAGREPGMMRAADDEGRSRVLCGLATPRRSPSVASTARNFFSRAWGIRRAAHVRIFHSQKVSTFPRRPRPAKCGDFLSSVVARHCRASRLFSARTLPTAHQRRIHFICSRRFMLICASDAPLLLFYPAQHAQPYASLLAEHFKFLLRQKGNTLDADADCDADCCDVDDSRRFFDIERFR